MTFSLPNISHHRDTGTLTVPEVPERSNVRVRVMYADMTAEGASGEGRRISESLTAATEHAPSCTLAEVVLLAAMGGAELASP
jgi:hypothetical protein